MITDILQEQLSKLLGNLSVYYSAPKILSNIQSQIDNLKSNSTDIDEEGLIFKYEYDINKLYDDYYKLNDTIEDIIENTDKINNVINKVSNFNLSIDYLKTLGEDYEIIKKYSTVIPKTINELDIFIDNVNTLQLAILEKSGAYILKKPISKWEIVAGIGLGFLGLFMIKGFFK